MCGHFLPWLQRNTGFWGLRKRHPQAQAVINVVMFFIFGRKRCIRCETTSLPQTWVCYSDVTLSHHIPFVCINRICVLLLCCLINQRNRNSHIIIFQRLLFIVSTPFESIGQGEWMNCEKSACTLSHNGLFQLEQWGIFILFKDIFLATLAV